eukprot:371078_1
MNLIVDFPATIPSRNNSRVSFADDLQITFIANLTNAHKDTLWFTNREMKHFKYQSAMILKALQLNNMTMAQFAELNANETSAFMGLENYLSETTTREIKYQRDAIRRQVLHEQDRQIREGVHDLDAMASVSEAASDWSRKRAGIIALIHTDKRD